MQVPSTPLFPGMPLALAQPVFPVVPVIGVVGGVVGGVVVPVLPDVPVLPEGTQPLRAWSRYRAFSAACSALLRLSQEISEPMATTVKPGEVSVS
jgi:hypothetical protein